MKKNIILSIILLFIVITGHAQSGNFKRVHVKDSISSLLTGTNLTLQGQGSGYVIVNDSLDVVGIVTGTSFNGVPLTSIGVITQYLNAAGSYEQVDFSDLSGSIADGQVPESAVTQHEAALTITESQISDLDHYTDADIDGNESAFNGWDKDESDDFTPTNLLTDYSFTDNSINWNTAYSTVTSNSANWNTAYSERNQWNGGATGLTAVTGRTSLGLGSIATQDLDNVSITGGAISGATIDGITLQTGGLSSQYLNAAGGYSTPAGGGGASVTIGLEGEIPFVNSAGDNFDYSGGFIFEPNELPGQERYIEITSNTISSDAWIAVKTYNNGYDRSLRMSVNEAHAISGDPILWGRDNDASANSLTLLGESNEDSGTKGAVAIQAFDSDDISFDNKPIFDGYNGASLEWQVGANGNWDFQGNLLKNVADPVDDQDVVTKAYLEATGIGASISATDSYVTITGTSASEPPLRIAGNTDTIGVNEPLLVLQDLDETATSQVSQLEFRNYNDAVLGMIKGGSQVGSEGLVLQAGSSIGDRIRISPDGYVDMNDLGLVAVGGSTPSSASDTGTTGTITWDSSYIYICTATDTWKRVAISTW